MGNDFSGASNSDFHASNSDFHALKSDFRALKRAADVRQIFTLAALDSQLRIFPDFRRGPGPRLVFFL